MPETNAIIHSTDICLAKVSTTEFEQLTGNKRYEFSNHLGDVMVVVTDRRIAADNGNNGSIDYYRAEVSMATDYYPFGMGMPERSYTPSTDYRFGYQNQETDDELWEGAVSYKYRIEDPRIGRFFSADPLSSHFSYNSPYAFSENRVIDGYELEGCEVVTIGANISGSLTTHTGYFEGGKALGASEDGLPKRYLTTGSGRDTEFIVAGSFRLSITIYPDMPTVQSLEGHGYSISGGTDNEFRRGLKSGVSFACQGVQSGPYRGINYQIGIGAGVNPVAISSTESNTTLTTDITITLPIGKNPLFHLALEQAKSILDANVEALNDENVELQKSIVDLRTEAIGLDLTTDDGKNKKIQLDKDISEKDACIEANIKQMDVLKEGIKEIENLIIENK